MDCLVLASFLASLHCHFFKLKFLCLSKKVRAFSILSVLSVVGSKYQILVQENEQTILFFTTKPSPRKLVKKVALNTHRKSCLHVLIVETDVSFPFAGTKKMMVGKVCVVTFLDHVMKIVCNGAPCKVVKNRVEPSQSIRIHGMSLHSKN